MPERDKPLKKVLVGVRNMDLKYLTIAWRNEYSLWERKNITRRNHTHSLRHSLVGYSWLCEAGKTRGGVPRFGSVESSSLV
jgi:hypothetical protein